MKGMQCAREWLQSSLAQPGSSGQTEVDLYGSLPILKASAIPLGAPSYPCMLPP